jgi:hypothetical protein
MSKAQKRLKAYDRIVECVVDGHAFVQLSDSNAVTRTEEPVVWVDGVTGEFETENVIYYPKDHHAHGMEEVVDEGCIVGEELMNTPFKS